MQKILLLITLLMSITLMSCNKDESLELLTPEYTYPSVGVYGENILDTVNTVYKYKWGSLAVTLKNNASLKLKITGEDNGIWYYTLGTEHNWAITVFNNSKRTQLFTSIDTEGKCELKIRFNKGKYKIEYYENNTNDRTRIKEFEVI